MRHLLRMLWAEPHVPAPPAPARRDGLLLAAIYAIAGLEFWLRPELDPRSPELWLSLALLTTLLWRRTRPFAMVALAFGVCTLAGLSRLVTERGSLSLNTLGFLLLLPYSLTRWGAGRAALFGLPFLFAAATVDIVLGPTRPGEAIGGYAVLCAALAIGAALRYRERAHERGIAQAKLMEREQLARDLHDTVAHHVSAIAIRAQAGLAVAATRPEATSEALRVIADEASRTLAEMRAIVRGLRGAEAAELAPLPSVGDLNELARQPGEGPSVEVALTGPLDDLPPALSSAIYRLAQESITNARKHARRATRIAVGVRADAASIRLEVRDDGERSELRAPSGFGLIGMSERAALLGGSCSAGPAPDRGWLVTVVLPRTGVTA